MRAFSTSALAGPLRKRVRQYCKTPLGAAKPHKGGWWLKTLAVLDDLHVHYAATPDFKDAEEGMLHTFAAGVSDASRALLPPNDSAMPFANLRDGDWRRRNHRITGATTGEFATKTSTSTERAQPVASSGQRP